MILLDTHVVSEAMKPEPHKAVRKWLNSQTSETLYISTVTLAELLFGIGVLPEGKRKVMLSEALNGVVELFKNRLLPFGAEAARQYANLAVISRHAGRGFPLSDGYIAAIAVSRGFVVASRDVSPFEGSQVVVIDPWTD